MQSSRLAFSKVNKPILKLTDEDYSENGLSDLIIEYASSYSINIQIFNRLQHTITGWPGGKANADDTHRPERAKPDKKRVIIFSPHPDDDVISMGELSSGWWNKAMRCMWFTRLREILLYMTTMLCGILNL